MASADDSRSRHFVGYTLSKLTVAEQVNKFPASYLKVPYGVHKSPLLDLVLIELSPNFCSLNIDLHFFRRFRKYENTEC